MIMQTIRMYDILDIRKKKKPGIVLTTNLPFIPTDRKNLVYKAAEMLMEEFGVEEGLSIKLCKFIPVAAGLAGGSSDAAAVLVGMNRIFNLGLKQNKLMELGLKIGADVPFCIMRGTALAEGIGEKLTPLPPMPKCQILIAKPPISVSTKMVYEKLDSCEIKEHPDIDGILDGLKNQDLEQVAASLGNVLEKVTVEAYPVIAQIKECMMEAGALGAMMSGSGPTVFGIFRDRRTAKEAFTKVKAQNLAKQIYLANVHNVRRR